MRITFTLAAILAASVNATPLAPTNNLSASTSTLSQISAHSLDAAPITTEAADDLWMGQTEADLDTLAEKGAKQKKLAELLEALKSSLTAHKANLKTLPENKTLMKTNFDNLSDHIDKMNGSGIVDFFMKDDKYKIDGEVSKEIKDKYVDGWRERWVKAMFDI